MANTEQSHWFRVEENKVEEIESLTDKRDRGTDREGGFPGGGPNMGATTYEGDIVNARREEHEHHHFRLVADKTKELWKSGSYQHLSIAVPEEYKHLIEDELKRDLPQVEVKVVYGNYGHGDRHDIHELFIKSLRPAWVE